MTETGILYPTTFRSVKAFIGEDIRRFAFAGATLKQLREHIGSLLPLPLEDNIPVFYQDDEGDWVTLGTDGELNLAFQLSGAKPLRVKVNSNLKIATAPPSPLLATDKDFKELKKEMKEQAKKEIKFAKKEVKKHFKEDLKAAKEESRQKWRETKGEKHHGDHFVGRFVKHVTVEDDSEYVGGTSFVKTWRFRNEGTIAWPEKCMLLFVGKKGDQMNAPPFVVIDRVVAPGEEVDVSVGMVAPSEPGSYFGYWRLTEPSGRKFGQRVRVMIKVAGSSSSSDDAETPSSWADMLNQLDGMGFKNKGLNVKLLVKTKGNLDKVIHRLLKHEQKMSGVKGKQ